MNFNKAAQIGDELGHDSFLIVESLPLAGTIRRAHALGWPRAADWLERQQQIRSITRHLTQDPAQHRLVVRTMGDNSLMLDGQPLDLGWAKARGSFLLPSLSIRMVLRPRKYVRRFGLVSSGKRAVMSSRQPYTSCGLCFRRTCFSLKVDNNMR